MKVYTYSEARQNLAALLDEAERLGGVKIRRRHGQTFVLRPETIPGSPLDVQGVPLDVSTRDIVAIVREGRKEYR